mmetsp:Transcript_20657/g.44968  ORF Transcript_20657/g.44968 Transcript_20657/m.44968 type:complete len:343 (+) Transcript_20657:164-1192(+)
MKKNKSNDSPGPPLIKVDTDSRANGIHLFQKPLRKPRFQTDSLECIGTAGLDLSDTSSIATSSFFDLIDLSDDAYTCGVSSIQIPLSQYVDTDEHVWPRYLKQNLNVLCTLIMNNNGDIYSHSLLECNDKADLPDKCRQFDGLPVGTRAIHIPNEIDGRTKFLPNSHWKQTGGMNLNLFLSNIYPVPRNAMLSRGNEGDDHRNNADGNHNKIILNNSKQKKIEEGAAVIQISKRLRKPGLMISTEDSNGNCNEMIKRDGDDRTLIMPLSHSKGAERNTIVYTGRNSSDSDSCHSIAGIGTKENEINSRSDLSRCIIQNSIENWEDTASEDESSPDEAGSMDF